MEFSGFREFICCGRDGAPGALAGDYIATLPFCPFASDPFRFTFELAV